MKKLILGLILLTGLVSCSKDLLNGKSDIDKHKGQCGIIVMMHPNGQYGASEYDIMIDVQFNDGWVGRYEVDMGSVSGQLNKRWCN